MPYAVNLELDGKNFEVLRCFSFVKQAFDESGNPAGGVIAGKLGLIMQGTADDTFSKWMGKTQTGMDGTITFSIEGSSFKKLEFKNGFLVRLHEAYHDDSHVQVGFTDMMNTFDFDKTEALSFQELESYYRRSGYSLLMSCTISAERISIDGVDHDNKW